MILINEARRGLGILSCAAVLALSGCTSYEPADYPAMAESVDLDRFMGVWHVQGYTPTWLDEDAYNALEIYELTGSGKIDTTYIFRQGGFDGDIDDFNPQGTVVEGTQNTEWRMKFFGLVKAPYLILHVDEAYSETLIGHPNRELAWIMTREPHLDPAEYDRLLAMLQERGYQIELIQRVPHEWPDPDVSRRAGIGE